MPDNVRLLPAFRDGVPPVEEGPRWAIWIDIEGFGELWSKDGLGAAGLRALMDGIFSIGTKVYTDDGDRLFAHQFGDGFIIVADFHEPQLDRCAAIAVALMRHVSRAGCFARAAIAEGDFADVSGLWPRKILEARRRDRCDDLVRLGSGLMTLLPVMGSALINANKLDRSNPLKGSILTLASENSGRVSLSFPRNQVGGCAGLTTIDWVHATSPILEEIKNSSGTGRTIVETEEALIQYFTIHRPPSGWVRGTVLANNISFPSR